MWDYSEKVLDHYRNPRNVGKIDDADLIGEAGSLACGDSLKLYLKLDGEKIVDAKFQTFGCGSAVASSSILTEMIIGKTLDEAKQITNKDIAEELGGLPQEKMHCSVMGHEALEDALKKYYGGKYGEDVVVNTPSETADKIVCTCFNVTEKQIWEAIKINNLKTVEEVTNYTKAGGKCGKCHNEIKRIIAEVNGTTIEEVPQKPKMSNLMKMKMVSAAIEEKISPALQNDGGDIELVDINGSDVFVKLHGACGSCPHALETLKSFVQETLRNEVSADINVFEAK